MCGSRSRWSGPARTGRAARHNYHHFNRPERKTEKAPICRSTLTENVSQRSGFIIARLLAISPGLNSRLAKGD